MNDTSHEIVVLGWWAEEQRRISFVHLLMRELGLAASEAKASLDQSLDPRAALITIPVTPERSVGLAAEIEAIGAECRVMTCTGDGAKRAVRTELRRQRDVLLARPVGNVQIALRDLAPAMSLQVLVFEAHAQTFCRFVEKAPGGTPVDRLRQAGLLLSQLYAAALLLPDVEPTSDTEPELSVSPPTDWAGFGEFEHYWEVFDPYKNDEPVCGSLSDDILDVYTDLKRGLQLWVPGEARRVDAAWTWRFGFRVHWGDHAVDALRAIHRALHR